MSNKQIADALNARPSDAAEDELSIQTYTPQAVTAMMRDVDSEAEWAAQKFLMDTFGPASD